MRTTDIERDVATHFADDVAEHRLIIRLDQGLHRHLVFEQREHAWNNRFELITAPSSLTITGDRGAHTFRRMADMFQFFRQNGNNHRINPSYWAEKLPDSGCSVKVYSEDTLKANVEMYLKDWADEYEDRHGQWQLDFRHWKTVPFAKGYRPAPKEPKTIGELRELIADYEADGKLMYEDGARELLGELEQLGAVSDTWEWDLRDWDYHFLWCLHAIAWGIQQYDNAIRSGLHVVRSGPVASDVPLPTVAPTPPVMALAPGAGR